MRAAIIHAPLNMQIGTWPMPQPAPNEVLVAVGATGVCAGDMYFYLGKNPYARYPQVCGHEIAGTIIEVGASVTGISVGTRVAVEPFISCGHCYPCRVGKGNCCANLQIIGVHHPGGFAEFVTAPATHAHCIPDALSLVKASFAEPVAIAVHACRRGNVGAETVLIMGCGPIGLALIEVARARGARVIAADHHASRLETAAQLGAEVLLSDDHLLEAVYAQTNGEGAPVVIEATGSISAMELSIELVAAGGRIVIVSLANKGAQVSLPALDFTRKEMTILGSRASTDCFPEALDLLASGALRYPQSATEFSLWDAPELFHRLAEDKSIVQKAVLINE